MPFLDNHTTYLLCMMYTIEMYSLLLLLFVFKKYIKLNNFVK